MAKEKEPNTLGLSDQSHANLQRLKSDGVFAEMADGYRFAIALALAHGAIGERPTAGKQTIFNVGSLDPDKSVYTAVRTLRSDTDEAVYRTAERLAEWGIEELARRANSGTLSFSEIFAEVDGLTPEA